MSLADIKAMPVADIAARDAYLFLWTTTPHLPRAFDVLSAWGFAYSTVAFAWVKLKQNAPVDQLRVVGLDDGECFVGMGYSTRQNVELVLLGRRGSPQRLARDVRQVIIAPRREHSRKPDAALDRIERFCAGPRLELFARTPRAGWTVWGNETNRFGAEAA